MVKRDGWAKGNALTFLIEHDSGGGVCAANSLEAAVDNGTTMAPDIFRDHERADVRMRLRAWEARPGRKANIQSQPPLKIPNAVFIRLS